MCELRFKLLDQWQQCLCTTAVVPNHNFGASQSQARLMLLPLFLHHPSALTRPATLFHQKVCHHTFVTDIQGEYRRATEGLEGLRAAVDWAQCPRSIGDFFSFDWSDVVCQYLPQGGRDKTRTEPTTEEPATTRCDTNGGDEDTWRNVLCRLA